MNQHSPTQRVALVTGAGQGIGRGIALRLAVDGFDVAVNDIHRSNDKAEAVADEIRGLGRRAIAVTADVSNPDDVATMVATTVSALGRLDVAVANAGIAQAQALLETTADEWDLMFAINVRGVFLTWQAAARQFISQRGGGKLIAAGSNASHRAASFLPAYSASKFAVRGLTQVAAMQWAEYGITANAYAPGVVNTPLWAGDPEGFAREAAKIPLGRAQEPEDVAALVSYFASPDSNYMTGQTVIMDGGLNYN
ncbi:SDR family oxidoreductase [Herbiconiux ginsengi]|uniref:Meso-butanediol dehydrogenase / (S,S)-butanediol dehydrogenase / diacetyl reductase n=1 Tax=Herbiconiux ginsengi TaxID=381665 RepID=A0A1H3U230_9MICO|nr:SDR family oxidoreductase [Herbiconiux ginsengi]SDZ55579.1 meso-butanediol dehydrogenase / (S,S)-butanediol dehydrogenase / diacetyl reductase [Herbiconiux ginsengi]